jgi:hypothetical protein
VDDGELRSDPANGRGAAVLVGRIARTARPHRCAALILIAIVGNDSDGSYREGGRVKKRTLANLSKLPQALIDGIVALLDGAKVSGKRSAEPGFEIVRSLPHGHVAAVQAMIRKLGLDRM